MSKFTLPKLRAKAPQSVVLPAWRADFRHKDRLPDIKPVRTDFLVNYGLVGLGLAVICFTAWREYSYFVQERDLEYVRDEVASRAAADRKILVKSGEFSANLRYTDAFVQFGALPLDPVKVLAEIGSIKVGDMVIRNVLVDAALTSASKKERARVVVVGVSNGVESINYSQVTEAFERLKSLPSLNVGAGFKVTPMSPNIASNTQDRVIDFTFEVQLFDSVKK